MIIYGMAHKNKNLSTVTCFGWLDASTYIKGEKVRNCESRIINTSYYPTHSSLHIFNVHLGHELISQKLVITPFLRAW